MTEEDAIIVTDLKKEFVLPHERKNTLKSVFVNPFKRIKSEKQIAFKDVSFTIKKGEFFGIVGKNGSGKSTLLKCLAGVYTPNSGSVKINGTLVPFIELGVGFNPELSGRDNVYLNGALLGFTRREVDAMYDEIVEFAELEEFMDQLLKNYSSGMQVRLAFSIAIRAKGDILLLDEVLAVGDAAFQTKCFNYFQELRKSQTTVVFISHDKNALERFCSRGVLINNGEIIANGPIRDVLDKYSRVVLDEIEKADTGTQQRKDTHVSGGVASIKKTWSENLNHVIQKKFVSNEKIVVSFKTKINKDLKNPVLGITIWEKNVNKPILVTNTLIEGIKTTGHYSKGDMVLFRTILPPGLNDGEYYIEPAIANEATSVFFDQIQKAATFHVSGGRNPYSILSSDGKIELVLKESK